MQHTSSELTNYIINRFFTDIDSHTHKLNKFYKTYFTDLLTNVKREESLPFIELYKKWLLTEGLSMIEEQCFQWNYYPDIIKQRILTHAQFHLSMLRGNTVAATDFLEYFIGMKELVLNLDNEMKFSTSLIPFKIA